MNIQKYSIALFTNYERNKTTTAISREIGTSQSTLSRFLSRVSINSYKFTSHIKNLFSNKSVNLIIDDFVLNRRYSNQTEGTSTMIDQSTKSFTQGIKIIGAGLTDGKFFLPIDLEQWIAQFIAKDNYLKKTELAQKIIIKISQLNINIKHFVLDGLYFSAKFITFLDDHNLKFVIKAKTTTSVIYKGQKIKLKDCSDLRLNCNQNQKKIKAKWAGKEWYFIAIRRTGKHGQKIIYLIANFEAKSKIYNKSYSSRWVIEKFIRTSKQSLGLNASKSQQSKIYLNHIRCVFFSYIILQLIMKKFHLRSAEDAIRWAQALKFKYPFDHIVDLISLFVNHA